MESIVYRSCPICGSRNVENIKRISFNMENILPDFYYLAACRQCGFIYANTPATAEDYEKYYNEHNKYSATFTIDNEADSIYNVISELLKRYINKDDAILDMGCGTGGLLLNMKQDGYTNLTGCDPSPESVAILKKKGLPCFKGSVYDPPKENSKKYNVVLLSGVLEHLFDLKKAINNISLYLKKGGKVIFNVPNVIGYSCPAPLPYYVNVEHINHFCPSAINKLFEQAAYSMLECFSSTVRFGTIYASVLIGVFENQNIYEFSLNKIKSYISDSDSKERENNKIINDLVNSKKSIAIWGTGNLARSYLKNSELGKAKIEFFVDNNREMAGKNFCGYAVHSPEYLMSFKGDILILSILYYQDIKKQILEMGINNNVIIIEG